MFRPLSTASDEHRHSLKTFYLPLVIMTVMYGLRVVPTRMNRSFYLPLVIMTVMYGLRVVPTRMNRSFYLPLVIMTVMYALTVRALQQQLREQRRILNLIR